MTGTALDHEKLIRVLGMLGSDHPGERANAAAAADRMIREAGLRWPDIIQPKLAPPSRRQREFENLKEALDYTLDFAGELSEWELSFIWSVRRQRTPISPKQSAIVRQIIEKCRRAEAAA